PAAASGGWDRTVADVPPPPTRSTPPTDRCRAPRPRLGRRGRASQRSLLARPSHSPPITSAPCGPRACRASTDSPVPSVDRAGLDPMVPHEPPTWTPTQGGRYAIQTVGDGGVRGVGSRGCFGQRL